MESWRDANLTLSKKYAEKLGYDHSRQYVLEMMSIAKDEERRGHFLKLLGRDFPLNHTDDDIQKAVREIAKKEGWKYYDEKELMNDPVYCNLASNGKYIANGEPALSKKEVNEVYRENGYVHVDGLPSIALGLAVFIFLISLFICEEGIIQDAIALTSGMVVFSVITYAGTENKIKTFLSPLFVGWCMYIIPATIGIYNGCTKHIIEEDASLFINFAIQILGVIGFLVSVIGIFCTFIIILPKEE